MVEFLQKFRKPIGWLALTAGLLNAGGLFIQALMLYESKNAASLSMVTFGIFIFIQIAYLLTAILERNKWLGIGMVASMVPTVWTMGMIYTYGGAKPNIYTLHDPSGICEGALVGTSMKHGYIVEVWCVEKVAYGNGNDLIVYRQPRDATSPTRVIVDHDFGLAHDLYESAIPCGSGYVIGRTRRVTEDSKPVQPGQDRRGTLQEQRFCAVGGSLYRFYVSDGGSREPIELPVSVEPIAVSFTTTVSFNHGGMK